MLIIDGFPQLGDWDVRILATDLSRAALERTRAARYTQQEVNRACPRDGWCATSPATARPGC